MKRQYSTKGILRLLKKNIKCKKISIRSGFSKEECDKLIVAKFYKEFTDGKYKSFPKKEKKTYIKSFIDEGLMDICNRINKKLKDCKNPIVKLFPIYRKHITVDGGISEFDGKEMKDCLFLQVYLLIIEG